MSLQALSSPTPSRLVCRRGRWALELTRLVAVDSHVFQPRRQNLEGTEAILNHLKRQADHAGLAQGALQLMRSLRGENEERTFEIVEGEWVPLGAVGSELIDEVEAPSSRETDTAVGELRAELLLLRGSHHRLRARVAALEARLEGLAVAGATAVKAMSLAPQPLQRLAGPNEALPNATMANATLQSAAAPESEPEPPKAAQAANPFRDVGAALGNGAAAPAVPITLCAATDWVAGLTQLFGADPGFAASDEPLPDSALELAALYAARLVDDEGNDVGAVLAEVRATACLGGKLMALPASLIDEQAKTGVLSEQVLQAMSEVCNAAADVLSRVAGNPRLRSTAIEPFAADRLPWVSSARGNLALGKARSGSLWLVAR